MVDNTSPSALKVSPEPSYRVRRLFAKISSRSSSEQINNFVEDLPDHAEMHVQEFQAPAEQCEPSGQLERTSLTQNSYMYTIYKKLVPYTVIRTNACPILCDQCCTRAGPCSDPGLCQMACMASEKPGVQNRHAIVGMDSFLQFLNNNVLKPIRLAASFGKDYTREHGGCIVSCGDRNTGKRFCVREFCRVNKLNYVCIDARTQVPNIIMNAVEFVRALEKPAIIYIHQFDLWAGQSQHQKFAQNMHELLHVLRTGILPSLTWLVLGSNLPSSHFYTVYANELNCYGAREVTVGRRDGTLSDEDRFNLLSAFIETKTNVRLFDEAEVFEMASTLPRHSPGNLWRLLENKLREHVSQCSLEDIYAARDTFSVENVRAVFFPIYDPAFANSQLPRKRARQVSAISAPSAVRPLDMPSVENGWEYPDTDIGSGDLSGESEVDGAYSFRNDFDLVE